jgi:hypothetical protein
MLIGHF